MLVCREGMFRLIREILKKYPNFNLKERNSLGHTCLNYLLVNSPWNNKIDHRVIWKIFYDAGSDFGSLDQYYRDSILIQIENFEIPSDLDESFDELCKSYLKSRKVENIFFRDRGHDDYRNQNDNTIQKLMDTLEEDWIFTVLPDQEKNVQVVVCRIVRNRKKNEKISFFFFYFFLFSKIFFLV